MAAATYFDTVQKIYIAFYQRPADPAGLKYWAEQIDLAGGDASAVVAAFATSAEATALYGTIDASTIGNVIDAIYMALFNRLPDAAGKQFYVDGFTAGTFTAGSIALDVLNGASGSDAIAVANKAAVANEFTAQVDGRPLTDAAFGTAPFAATYAGDTDAGAARGILATVTEDAGTILTPTQVTQQIQVQIADAGDAIITFSLIASASSVSEGASVTFNVVGGQANFTYSYDLTGVDAADVTGGALTGTITTDANGKGSFTVALANDRVSDGVDTLVVTLPNTGKSASVTVNDTSTDNIAPVAVDATNATTEAGAVVTGQLVATDAENDAVTFALDAAVEGLTLNADGTYSFDPSLNTAAQALTYKSAALDVVANYTVTDALGATDTGTITITVTPKPLTFTLTADKTSAEEGATTVYTVKASEALIDPVDVVFTLQPGDGLAVNAGTANTNTADFATGAFNPTTVTIAAGADTATFDVVAVNDATTELQESYSVKAEVAGETLTVSSKVVDATGAGGVGQTFTLTTGINAVGGVSPNLLGSANSYGTDGDDTIVALIDATVANNTLNALDSVDGGLGNNSMTLNMVGAAALPGGITISNVQTINARGSAAVTLDLTAAAGITGVTALNSTLSTTATLAAAATTDVNVSGATGAIDVAGGKNVVVSDATADQAINVGESGVGSTNAAGTITVTDTKQGNADITVDGGTTVGVTATIDATTTAVAGGDILIGGTTKATGAVTVVQNLNSNGGDNEADDLTAAAITVSGGSTVDITVNATSNAKDETSDGDIGIGAVTVNGDGKTTTVTVNQNASTTTFTKAGSALVKESSVVTFGAMKSGETLIINGLTFTAAADLTAEQAAAAFANLTAADSQSEGGVVTNGEYTGAFSTAVWTSGAATGNVVTFTAQDQDEADLVFTGTAATNDAGARIPTQVKTAGAVAVAADPSGNTVTFGAVTIVDSATAAIKTITVNGYATGSTIGGAGTETDALETLSLAAAAGSMTVADTADTLALSLAAMGSSAADVVLTFTAAPLTLNVTSTGSNYVNLTAAATKELNVSGTGLLDIDATDLAALETVKVTGSAGLSLNAGVANTVTSVDTTGTTGTVTATIDADIATYAGGAGVDNVTLSTTTVDKSVNLGGGNDTLTLAAGTTALTSEMIGGDGTDTLAMASADAETASATTTFETKITGFERLALGQVAAAATDTIDLANLDDINHVTTAGGAATAVALNLDNMAVGGTLQYTGALLNAAGVTDVDFVDASGSADSFNVVLNVSGAALDFQDLDISGIETLNLTATDSVTTTIESATINVLDTSLKSVAITGNAAVVFSANSTVLTLVDGSAMTAGGLTATTNGTVAQTIKGGAGVDNLTASFAQDVLEGGAGADTLTVANGANLVSLNGGAGKDTYVIGLATNSSGYASIAGTAAELSGDVIQFGAAIADFAAAKIVLAGTAVFQDYANEATKSAVADNNVSWFQFQGDTYVVQNNSTSTSFDNGVDAIVKIVGLVNFTYNVAGTLEIA